jgi:hypothetical protein
MEVDIICQERVCMEAASPLNEDQDEYGSMFNPCKQEDTGVGSGDAASTNNLMTSGQNLSSW